MLSGNKSIIVILLIFTGCIWNSYNEHLWDSPGVIIWDANCYYAYLQEVGNGRTYGDTVTADEKKLAGLTPNQKYLQAPNGNMVIKTSMGMSFLYSPFYALGYLFHYLNHGNAGYGSEVEYRKAMQFFGSFILLLALFALQNLLRRYFTDNITAITIVCMAIGTNLFYYTTYEPCMPHGTNVLLIILFTIYTIKWHTNAGIKNTIIVGLLAGLITLIRPTNILVGVLFVFYNVSSVSQLSARFKFLITKWYLILLSGIMAIVVWLPQMIYLYNLTGHLLYYSYGKEEFHFTNPQIFMGLFSGRKGWLLYTPMGAFMLLGFIFMCKYVKDLFWAILIMYTLFVYVIFSWWCWWYGGSFSSRAMVDVYGLLALPLAALLTYVYNKQSIVLKTLLTTILLFFIFLNLFQTYQYKKGIIHYSDMSLKAYKYVFLRTGRDPVDFLERPPGYQ